MANMLDEPARTSDDAVNSADSRSPWVWYFLVIMTLVVPCPFFLLVAIGVLPASGILVMSVMLAHPLLVIVGLLHILLYGWVMLKIARLFAELVERQEAWRRKATAFALTALLISLTFLPLYNVEMHGERPNVTLWRFLSR